MPMPSKMPSFFMPSKMPTICRVKCRLPSFKFAREKQWKFAILVLTSTVSRQKEKNPKTTNTHTHAHDADNNIIDNNDNRRHFFGFMIRQNENNEKLQF